MKAQKVIVKRKAIQAIKRQVEYYLHTRQSPQTAKNFRTVIKQTIDQIELTPNGFQLMEGSKDLRRYPENRYHIYVFYTYQNGVVYIEDVKGQGQDEIS